MKHKFLIAYLFLASVAMTTALPVLSGDTKIGNKTKDEVSGAAPTRLVYQSFSQVRETLENPEILKTIPEISELNRLLSKVNTTAFSSCAERKFPLIVLEGLDGAGKTTLSKGVAERLGFQVIKNVPPSVNAFKPLVNHLNESASVKRAWMTSGNYVGAQEIADICTQSKTESSSRSVSLASSLPKGILMDRFWTTSGAMGISQKIKEYGNDSVSPSDYLWPSDLPLPDLVIFLDVNEENRHFRVHHREKQVSKKEQNLAESPEYRQLLIDSFNGIRGPKVIHVDVNNSNAPPNATKQENINAVADQVCRVIEQNLPYFNTLTKP